MRGSAFARDAVWVMNDSVISEAFVTDSEHGESGHQLEVTSEFSGVNVAASSKLRFNVYLNVESGKHHPARF